MTDTPSHPLPLDPREQPILDSLNSLRDELTLLKQDRTTYIKAADVLTLYDKVVDQVKLLNEIRADKPDEQNRVDRVLDGCFQLLSLFFMTIGKTNEAPAAYSLTSTIKRLLDHLTEVDLYCEKDLAHVTQTLERLGGIVKNAKPSYSPRLLTLLSNRIEICQRSLKNLSTRLERISGELSSIHEKIISILRSISLANTRSKFSATEVTKLQTQLKEIDSQRVDGKFVTVSGETPAGNDEVCEHLERCLKWAECVLERKGQFPEAFQGVYSTLVEIRNKLEKLSLTQAWSLRETDLYDFQRQLDKIDESRVDGNFVDAEGNFAELYVQRALLPVYNQLQTLRRCLIEVKNSGGVSSPRELYPYSMKLNSIDNMRVDGKFMVGPDIPEGQGSVNDLLAECFELSYELRVAAESESDV
ncbi:hypothetical protein NHQ30_008645 [Ciborinia camelliae]|nr:hypothetical protein NHQ30_008645 [Ciborinia camelliae]